MNPTDLPGWRWSGGMFAVWMDGDRQCGGQVVGVDSDTGVGYYLYKDGTEPLPPDAQPMLDDPATAGCITGFMTNLYLTMGPDRQWSVEDDEVEVTSHPSLGQALFYLAQTRGEWA